MELMAPYLSRGYNMYIDSWCSSPTLFEKLFQASLNVVGTIRLNRMNMPEKLKKQKLEKGDGIAMYIHKMMAVNLLPFWQQCMTTLAWWTRARQAGKWEPVQKPKPVLYCNKGIRGWTEWTSSLRPTVLCAIICRHIRSSCISLTWRCSMHTSCTRRSLHRYWSMSVQAFRGKGITRWTGNARICKMRLSSNWYVH